VTQNHCDYYLSVGYSSAAFAVDFPHWLPPDCCVTYLVAASGHFPCAYYFESSPYFVHFSSPHGPAEFDAGIAYDIVVVKFVFDIVVVVKVVVVVVVAVVVVVVVIVVVKVVVVVAVAVVVVVLVGDIAVDFVGNYLADDYLVNFGIGVVVVVAVGDKVVAVVAVAGKFAVGKVVAVIAVVDKSSAVVADSLFVAERR
jgi:hypothetical protein